jgi:hypothetical protein
MAENNESFRDELGKFAKIADLLEESFIGQTNVDFEIKIDESKIDFLVKNLNTNKNDKLIVSIGNVNFIFLKK